MDDIEGEPAVADATTWLFAGPLGSGKTLASKIAEAVLMSEGEYPYLTEFSDHVRWAYENEGPGNEPTNDNGLGRWAGEVRKERGMDYFAESLATQLGGATPAANHIIVSGVRSPTTPDVFRKHFENVVVVVMWSMPELRLTRVDESEGDFFERNRREMEEWGCQHFFLDPAQYDYLVPNNYNDEELLRAAITRIVLDEYDGSRDASVFEKAPWHADYEMRMRQQDVHAI